MPHYQNPDVSASPDETPNADCTSDPHAPACCTCKFSVTVNPKDDSDSGLRCGWDWERLKAKAAAKTRIGRNPCKVRRGDDDDDDDVPVIPPVDDNYLCSDYQPNMDLIRECCKEDFGRQECDDCDAIATEADRQEQRRSKRRDGPAKGEAPRAGDAKPARHVPNDTPLPAAKADVGAFLAAYQVAAEAAGRPDVPEDDVRAAFKAHHPVSDPAKASRERQNAWTWAKKKIPATLEKFKIGKVEYIRQRPR